MVQKNTIIYYFQQPVFRKPVISVNFHLQLNWNYDVILKICFSGFSDIFHNYIHYHHTKFRIVIICLKQVTGGSFAWNTALGLLLFVCEYLGLHKCKWSVCVSQVDKNRSEITWITFSDLRTRLVRKKEEKQLSTTGDQRLYSNENLFKMKMKGLNENISNVWRRHFINLIHFQMKINLRQKWRASRRLFLIWAATILRFGRPLIVAPGWTGCRKFSKK